MSDLTISNARIREGVWQGVLVAGDDRAEPPEIQVLHQTVALDGVRLVPDSEMANLWTLNVPIPVELLCDGVQTFVVSSQPTGAVLARFSIVTGQPMEDDIRAEVDMLRAELDLLKKAFRRHCVETAPGA